MKRVLLLIAALFSCLVLSACGDGKPKSPDSDKSTTHETKLTLWVFPVGNWSNPTEVASLMSAFHKKHPEINVSVEHLTYETGDEKIEQAIADGTAPDLVFEGPERLVANWGAKGLLADLSDLWETNIASTIYDNVREACQRESGTYYEFPICMTAQCMAINYDMFEAAGALKYIDEKTHTWTTEGFIKAVQALVDYGQKNVGAIYCKNQSGDQGTRALVNNLYGGSFTNTEHTSYTVDSDENIQALQTLHDLNGITFEPSMSAMDTIDMFCNGELAMTFCWNVAMEIQQTINNPDLDFDIFPMAFPTSSGPPKLPGGIWGFGVFDNGDSERVNAAKDFIRYMTEDETLYIRTVWTSSQWPVHDQDNVYINDMLMTEYSIFLPYLGDYYQITPGWAEARTAWWKALQKIEAGTDIAEAVKHFP